MGKYKIHSEQELEAMPDEEYERLEKELVRAFNDLGVNHSKGYDLIGLETLLSRVEELREAPKWTLGKNFHALSKKQCKTVTSAREKAEKLRVSLVDDLKELIGDGMLVFDEPVKLSEEDEEYDEDSFIRIFMCEEWDDDECEYEYWLRCDTDPFGEGIPVSELSLKTLLEVFSRMKWSEARLYSEEEVAACDGYPKNAPVPEDEALAALLKKAFPMDGDQDEA